MVFIFNLVITGKLSFLHYIMLVNIPETQLSLPLFININILLNFLGSKLIFYKFNYLFFIKKSNEYYYTLSFYL